MLFPSLMMQPERTCLYRVDKARLVVRQLRLPRGHVTTDRSDQPSLPRCSRLAHMADAASPFDHGRTGSFELVVTARYVRHWPQPRRGSRRGRAGQPPSRNQIRSSNSSSSRFSRTGLGSSARAGQPRRAKPARSLKFKCIVTGGDL